MATSTLILRHYNALHQLLIKHFCRKRPCDKCPFRRKGEALNCIELRYGNAIACIVEELKNERK